MSDTKRDRGQRAPVPREEWIWHGMPGHFIGSDRCCFHLVTDIGDRRVSTIGCYHGPEGEQSYATRKPVASGKWLYETMVFKISTYPPHPEAHYRPVENWESIDGDVYMTEAQATAGHQRVCERVAGCATVRSATDQEDPT
jgi:hypothetical protein